MASREQDGVASRSAWDEHATAAMAADLERARPAMQKATDYAGETATRSPPAGPASTWSRDNYARALLQFGYPATARFLHLRLLQHKVHNKNNFSI